MRKLAIPLIVVLFLTISFASAIVVDQKIFDALDDNGKAQVIVFYKEQGIAPPDTQKFNTIEGFTGEITLDEFNDLISDPNVFSIQKDYKLKIKREVSAEIINATALNALNITGKNQTICVIDTGIDYSHDEFGNCSLSEYQNGTCYGGKLLPGYDYVNDDANPADDEGHGTFIAGIIKQMAPDAKMVNHKVCDQNGDCYTSAMINAIDQCLTDMDNDSITVLSVSIGDESSHPDENCFPSDPLAMIINIAHDSGIFVAIASGNNGFTTGINYPACAGGAVSVGSTTKLDAISSFTNTYSTLDLLAPGSSINSTYPGDTYAVGSGTSFSTPMVAAGAALLKEADGNLTPDQIEIKMKVGGFIINSTLRGGAWPRLDLAGALAAGTECFVDSDCGTDEFVTNPICVDNSLYRNFTTYSCTIGYCSSETNPVLSSVCPRGCVNGSSICKTGGGGGPTNELTKCEIDSRIEWQTGEEVNVLFKAYDTFGGLHRDYDEVRFTVFDDKRKEVYVSTLPDIPNPGMYNFTYIPDQELVGNFVVECYIKDGNDIVTQYKDISITSIGGLRTTFSLFQGDSNTSVWVSFNSIMTSLHDLFWAIIGQFKNVFNLIFH